MTVSERIIQRAKELNIRQTDIVRALNCSKGTVNQWFKGETSPSGENLIKTAKVLGVSPEWLQTGKEPRKGMTMLSSAENAELVGVSGFFKAIPVLGTAKLGVDGDYSFEQVEPGTVLDVPTKDVDACALRVVGDSMHPAIRHGWYVVIEPSVDPKNGLYVAVEMLDGRRMVKELLGMDADYIRLESVNPAHGRVTVESKDIKTIQAVTMIVQASKARMVV